jgi:hypothetical protein
MGVESLDKVLERETFTQMDIEDLRFGSERCENKPKDWKGEEETDTEHPQYP